MIRNTYVDTILFINYTLLIENFVANAVCFGFGQAAFMF